MTAVSAASKPVPKPKDHAGKDFGTRHARFAKTGAIPRDFKPFRDRTVPTISVVPCPDCKSAIGDHCVGLGGTTKRTPHPSRRRMAVRALNSQESA